MSSDLSSTAGYCSGRERSRRRLTWILCIHGVTGDFDEKSIWIVYVDSSSRRTANWTTIDGYLALV